MIDLRPIIIQAGPGPVNGPSCPREDRYYYRLTTVVYVLGQSVQVCLVSVGPTMAGVPSPRGASSSRGDPGPWAEHGKAVTMQPISHAHQVDWREVQREVKHVHAGIFDVPSTCAMALGAVGCFVLGQACIKGQLPPPRLAPCVATPCANYWGGWCECCSGACHSCCFSCLTCCKCCHFCGTGLNAATCCGNAALGAGALAATGCVVRCDGC